MTGQTVSHYVVRDRLGDGGSSVVYRAEDVALRRDVVLKFLSAEQSDDGSVARFHHEARTVSSLNHPNICTVYEIGEHQGQHFLAMELLDGDVLSRVINGRPMDPYRVVEMAAQMADALDAAHAEGIVHRDLKPANIFVTRHDRVKLLDFGLAVLLPRRPLTNSTRQAPLSSSAAGTIPYMSPEQARAEGLDQRTDLFSLGAVMYEMATGRRPFSGATPRDVLDAIVGGAPAAVRELAASVPSELERIIDKALEKNPRLRYQTASDLRADLQRLKRDLDSAQHPRAVPRRLAAPSRRRDAASALAGGTVVVAVAIAMIVKAWRHQPAAAPPVAAHEKIDGRPGGDAAVAAAALPASAPAAAPTPKRGHAVAAPNDATPPPGRSSRTTSTGSTGSTGPAGTPPAPEAAVIAEPSRDAAPRTARDADLQLARQQIDLKLYDQALDSLRRVAQSGSGREAVEASFLIASIHETRGDHDAATSAYLEVANRHADDARAPEALVKMAESTLKSRRAGKEADARRILTDVVARYPGSSRAPQALLLRGELEERLKLWQRDGELGTSVPTALITYREAGRRYASSRAGAAALDRLARIYVETKRYDLAAAAFATLAERDDANRYDAWFNAGELYDKRLKDTPRARAAYERVPAASPRYADARKRLRK